LNTPAMPKATVLVFDNCNATSVTAFVDVLGIANQLWSARERDAAPLFAWQLCSPDGRAVTTSSGLKLEPHGELPRGRSDVVYVPACHFTTEERLLREIDALAARTGSWLRAHPERGG